MKILYLTFITVLAAFQFTDAQWTTSGTYTYNTTIGNIGIGTTTPRALLEASTGTGSNSWIYMTNTAPPVGTTQIGSTVKIGAVITNNRQEGQIQYQNNFGIVDNNAGLVRLYVVANGYVGIGTTGPQQKLTVVMDGATNGTGIAAAAVNGSGTGSQPAFAFLNNVGSKRMYSYLDVATDSYNIANAANTNVLSITQAGNVGIGTSNPGAFMLGVKGNVHAQQVNVDMTGWSDYVFKTDYRLHSLQEVKAYIDQNHHLPEIPSEQQIVEDGLNLGEMDKLLVKKVEELTLYLIEKDKKEKEQEERIKKLEEEVKELLTKAKS